MLNCFAVFAGLGFVASLAVHLAALFGLHIPDAAWALHAGAMIAFIPALLEASRKPHSVKIKMKALLKSPPRWSNFLELWNLQMKQQRHMWDLNGCPHWMKYGFYATFAYCMAVMMLFIILTVMKDDEAFMNAHVFIFFSSGWMAFYSMEIAYLYSATHVPLVEEVRCCPNGHIIHAPAERCEECGHPPAG